MNQEMVEITALGQGGVWVEGTQRSACHSCSARAGCGQHSLSQLGRPLRLWVPASGQWQVGQQVLLLLPRGSLAGSALLLYGLPLLTLLPAAVLGQQWGGDGMAALLGLACLLAGFALSRGLAQRFASRWQPQIQSHCPSVRIATDRIETEPSH